jgi:monoamine oxidase
VKRRTVLQAGALLIGGCGRPRELAGGWIGVDVARGHRLRGELPKGPAVQRRTSVLIVGAGIAGLAAARELDGAGVDDLVLLELEDQAGGNSRGHVMGGLACPRGAHYLPLPGPQAHEVQALLFDLGLATQRLGRTEYDERHLCHSPQERLFIDGAWVDGLLPPAPPGSAAMQQDRRFGQRVDELQRELGFAMPTHRAPWTAAHQALDAQTFAQWLGAQGFDDPSLRWYLDYACRDDYGASSAEVSAWAGIHYFASRHGFHAPGDEAEREPVLTWPQGNAWLAQRLAAPLGDRLHGGRTVLQASIDKHGVSALAWDEAHQRLEQWQADQLVLAVPLFIAARLLQNPPPALVAAAARQAHAPWLVANLQLDEPLLERGIGAPLSWDNVPHGGDPRALGYVDANHQSLRPDPGATVLTAYWALPRSDRRALLDQPWQHWAQAVITDLARVHPDLPAKVQRADLMRYGHAMSIPLPGQRGSAALRALQQPQGRLHFAHADLSAYSVFEEAYTHGVRAGQQISNAGRRIPRQSMKYPSAEALHGAGFAGP